MWWYIFDLSYESFMEHIWLSENKAQEVLWFRFVKFFFHNLDFIDVILLLNIHVSFSKPLQEFGNKEWTKTTFCKVSDASEAVGSSAYSDVLFAFVSLFSFFFSLILIFSLLDSYPHMKKVTIKLSAPWTASPKHMG